MATYNTLQTNDDLLNWQANNSPCGLADSPSKTNGQDPFADVSDAGTDHNYRPNLGYKGDLAFLASVGEVGNEPYQIQTTTFGVRTTCVSITHLCNITGNRSNGTCNGAPSEFTWNSNYTSNFGNLNLTVPHPVSYPIMDDPSERPESWYTGADEYFHLLDYPINTTSSGGYMMFMQLWWPYLEEGYSEILAKIGQGPASIVVLNCNFTYYNLTVQYDYNNTYGHAVVDEVISERFLSDGFSGPLRAGLLFGSLMNTIIGNVVYGSSDTARMDGINDAFAELALFSASIAAANMTAPALWQEQGQTQILGRYPIIPVVLLVFVLLLNSLFALVICVVTSFSRTDSIRITGKSGSKSVPLLDLARLRLVSPGSLVADRFPLKGSANLTREEIQAMRDTLNMFCEDTVDRRVRIGMHEDKESGEWVFGTWVEESNED